MRLNDDGMHDENRENVLENMDDAVHWEKWEVLVDGIKNLCEQAFLLYKPIVDDICSGKAVSAKELENLLDWLVSICISDEMLGLFKQVSRQFYNQYPEIITDYVMIYKEMYEEDVID